MLPEPVSNDAVADLKLKKTVLYNIAQSSAKERTLGCVNSPLGPEAAMRWDHATLEPFADLFIIG